MPKFARLHLIGHSLLQNEMLVKIGIIQSGYEIVLQDTAIFFDIATYIFMACGLLYDPYRTISFSKLGGESAKRGN